MISAIDTNVLLDILIPNADFADNSLKSLENADKKGDMIICELVFAELSTQFSDLAELQMFLHDTGIQLVNSNMQALYRSGIAWKSYLSKKKQDHKCPHCRKAIPGKRHIISDFIIGGHALVLADQLITRDRGVYRTYFKNLKISDPSKP